jgi:hypothetical protein
MCCRIIIVVAAILAASPAATIADERSLQVSARERAACMPDARRLCGDAMPNVRRVVMCFLGKKAKLSNGCRAVLASYGL